MKDKYIGLMLAILFIIAINISFIIKKAYIQQVTRKTLKKMMNQRDS